MKKAFAALLASSLLACTSVETATVASSEVATPTGEAVAVIQGTSIGITALLNIVDIVRSDLDTVVNRLLIAEAKAMGASRVELNWAYTTPRSGIFALPSLVLGFPMAAAQGVAVK
jgi:hypothetical protein